MTFSFHLMTAEARAFLEKAYGDLNAYLVSKIEAEVRVQKQQDNTIMLGEPFIAELKEAPDVTTVAATVTIMGVGAFAATLLPLPLSVTGMMLLKGVVCACAGGIAGYFTICYVVRSGKTEA